MTVVYRLIMSKIEKTRELHLSSNILMQFYTKTSTNDTIQEKHIQIIDLNTRGRLVLRYDEVRKLVEQINQYFEVNISHPETWREAVTSSFKIKRICHTEKLMIIGKYNDRVIMDEIASMNLILMHAFKYA